MVSLPGLEKDIAVWFLCGAASAVALKKTVERFGIDRVRAINNPVREEHEDNLRFMQDVSRWVGVGIETSVNPKCAHGAATIVWDESKAMSFPKGAPCTRRLKKAARQHWEAENKVYWHVFGFTVDEKKRHDNFTLTERANVIPVLIDAGLTKDDCVKVLHDAGLRLPHVYSLGYPNANCIGCVKATSPTYWNLVRRTFPVVFQNRAEQSRRLGTRLVRVKGQRIFLDELDPNAEGRPLKSMPDCGITCEEGRDEYEN